MMKLKLIVAVALTGFLAGCTLKVDNPQLTVGSTASTGLVCTVTPSANPADSGSSVNLVVDVGSYNFKRLVFPPFSVEGTDGQFSGESFTVPRTYTNATGASEQLDDSVVITDSKGTTLTCSFSMTVKAPVTTPTALACAADITPASPHANENFIVTATATGGATPYVFSALTLGTGGTVVTDLSSVNGSQSAATAKYSATGSKTLTITLTDHDSNTATCTKTLTVQAAGTTTGTPAVTVTATPGQMEPIAQPITLTTAVSGFSTTPTLTFSTTEAGVSIQVTGTNAVIKVTDANFHLFWVKVTAQTATASAEYWIELEFYAPELTCTLGSATYDSYWGVWTVSVTVPAAAKAFWNPYIVGVIPSDVAWQWEGDYLTAALQSTVPYSENVTVYITDWYGTQAPIACTGTAHIY